MFTEQAVVHASQSLTSLSLNTNTTQSYNQNPIIQPKTQPDRYNFHYHQPQNFTPHAHHYPSSTQSSASSHQQQHYLHHQQQPQSHNYYRHDKQTHTLPSSLPTSIETSILCRSSIIEHCSCGLSFKVDKNTNNIITSSTSLLTLNTIYNENPTLIDQTNNQGYLTQSQNILQDTKHHNRRSQQQELEPETNYKHNYHQHHAHHCHHHQQNSSTAPALIAMRYKPSAPPPEIHTHEYFSQESQTQDLTNTITNTTVAYTTPTSLNSFSTPHSHGCRHSHVHAQTDFSYGSR